MNDEELKGMISIAVGICRNRAQDKNLSITETQEYTNSIIDKILLRLNDITVVDANSVENLIISIEEKDAQATKRVNLKVVKDNTESRWQVGRLGEIDW